MDKKERAENGANMDIKANFYKMMADLMSEDIANEIEKSCREVAKFTKGLYDSLRAEGFTKAEAQHYTDMMIMGMMNR